MNTKSKIFIGLIVLASLGLAGVALAHNPRLVDKSGETIKIQNPEISQAYYGILEGDQRWFEIDSDKNFVLYVNLLVPKLPDINKGLLFEIYKVENGNQQLIANLDGENFNWTEFYEPFGGDTYLKGPEFKAEVGKGNYLIKVTHCHADEPAGADETACAFSKYVLVVGEQEKFPPKEILNAVYLLPIIKKDFFNESPLGAYFNYSGLFLLGVLVILSALIFLIFRLIKRARKKEQPVTF